MTEQRPQGSPIPQPPRPQITPLQQPRPTISPAPGGPPKINPIPNIAPRAHDDEPISLVDEPKPGAAPAVSKIKSFSSSSHASVTHNYKRQPIANGQGACRVRSFHGRLSEEGMEFMDNKINEWLDNHPEIEVKFVTTNIGQFEGKVRELALVVNVWY